jgi:lambda repressor-like predicted transcriptional regulator
MKRLTDIKRRLMQAADQITDAYEKGWTLRELAKVHDASPGSIRNLLIEEGVKMRSRGTRKKEK